MPRVPTSIVFAVCASRAIFAVTVSENDGGSKLREIAANHWMPSFSWSRPRLGAMFAKESSYVVSVPGAGGMFENSRSFSRVDYAAAMAAVKESSSVR